SARAAGAATAVTARPVSPAARTTLTHHATAPRSIVVSSRWVWRSVCFHCGMGNRDAKVGLQRKRPVNRREPAGGWWWWWKLERGAFTDAKQDKRGLFQAAHRGTLFLDEVGLLSEAPQAKLLKALEERAVRRLGSTQSEAVDVWVIAATNADLEAATRERRFRGDLYHRLAVLTLWLPPLRERGHDTLLLADRFLARACVEYGLAPKTFAPD